MKVADVQFAGMVSTHAPLTPSASATHQQLAALVRAAADGDQVAWDGLVDRFSPMLWSVARSTGLNAADAGDVCQTTWLRLLENLQRIDHPERVAGWLATTVRREAIRTSQRGGRSVLTYEPRTFDAVRHEPAPELPRDDFFVRELAAAVAELPERSRTLIGLLLAEPALTYSEISETLTMPVGSIGPTRARILATIRAKLERRGISASDVASE
jgi:RNA polymerase sigma factor (sigma-70 family)